MFIFERDFIKLRRWMFFIIAKREKFTLANQNKCKLPEEACPDYLQFFK